MSRETRSFIVHSGDGTSQNVRRFPEGEIPSEIKAEDAAPSWLILLDLIIFLHLQLPQTPQSTWSYRVVNA
jgi:hypothetical protein